MAASRHANQPTVRQAAAGPARRAREECEQLCEAPTVDGRTIPCPFAVEEHERCTLDQLTRGCRVCIQRVDCAPATVRRLAQLGIRPGVELSVLQSSGGPLLVRVGDARLALGRAIAGALLVRPLTDA